MGWDGRRCGGADGEATASRARWAAVGAAVAVSLGAGGVGMTQAAIGSGEKPVAVAIAPCRLVDTRPGPSNIGGRTAPLGANDTLVLQVTGSAGQCSGVPADAVAAALNVTAIQGSTQSFLSIYPSDAALPNASSLNWGGGDPPTPNHVAVELGPTGAIKITNSAGTVHVAVDLVGYTIDHHHDDRYYSEAEVDAVVERERVVAASASVVASGAAAVPLPFTPEEMLSVTVDAAARGLLQVEGTLQWDDIGAGAYVECRLFVDGVAVPASYRRVNREHDCDPSGAVTVSSGRHTVTFEVNSDFPEDVRSGTLDALFVPGGSATQTSGFPWE